MHAHGVGSHDVSMLSILVVCFFKKKTKDVEVIGVQSRVSETTRDSLEQPLSLQHPRYQLDRASLKKNRYIRARQDG
jgi:hypothetical protein